MAESPVTQRGASRFPSSPASVAAYIPSPRIKPLSCAAVVDVWDCDEATADPPAAGCALVIESGAQPSLPELATASRRDSVVALEEMCELGSAHDPAEVGLTPSLAAEDAAAEGLDYAEEATVEEAFGRRLQEEPHELLRFLFSLIFGGCGPGGRNAGSGCGPMSQPWFL